MSNRLVERRAFFARPLELKLGGALPEGFENECALAVSVGVTICRVTLGQAVFQDLVFSGKRRICAQQIAEGELFLGILRHPHVDMMCATRAEWRHAFHEKHSIVAWVL